MTAVPSPVLQLTCDDLLRLKLSLWACLVRLTGTRWAIEACPGRQTVARPSQLPRPSSRQGWHRHMTLCLLLPFCLLQDKPALTKSPV